MKKKISICLAAFAALVLAAALLCGTAAAEDGSPFAGDWQLRYHRDAHTAEKDALNPSYYGLEVTMTLLEDGTVRLTEIHEGETTVTGGTWTQTKKNECVVAFDGLDTVTFRLANGVLRSIGKTREYYTYTQHDTAGEMSLGLPVDAYHFPDAGFRQYIIDYFGYIEDYTPYLSTKEIHEVKELSISGKNFTSLQGIQYLTELTALYCDGLPITELDVSACAKLKTLSCRDCKLEKLTLGGALQLVSVHCENNRLASLDAAGLPRLKELDCENNRLEELLVSGDGALQELGCSTNSLTELDASGCGRLKTLYCSGNRLEALSLDGDKALQELCCSGNRLTGINLEPAKALQKADLSDNSELSAVTLGKHSQLAGLTLWGTAVTELDLSGCPRLQKLARREKDGSYTMLDTNKNGSVYLYLHGPVRIILNAKVTIEPD